MSDVDDNHLDRVAFTQVRRLEMLFNKTMQDKSNKQQSRPRAVAMQLSSHMKTPSRDKELNSSNITSPGYMNLGVAKSTSHKQNRLRATSWAEVIPEEGTAEKLRKKQLKDYDTPKKQILERKLSSIVVGNIRSSATSTGKENNDDNVRSFKYSRSEKNSQ